MFTETVSPETKRLLAALAQEQFVHKYYLAGGTADSLDCACMKLDAISSRGLRRDFYDLYMILHEYTLKKLLEAFQQKYTAASTDPFHLLRSLTYFADADADESINLLKPLEWNTVKTFFVEQVRAYSRARLV